MIGIVPFQLASAYSLSVVPLFILMGAVAARANMATELFEAANAMFSGVRGALTNATIGACAMFGAICGSSFATAATFSRVAIPEMRRHGYDPALAAGAVAAGTLGVLIPPSVLIAIYAIVAEQSLLKLYAAAFIRGFLLAGLYVIAVFVVAWRRPGSVPRIGGMSLGRRLRATLGLWKMAILSLLAVFGIYFGWFSPTEAAAVAAFAAIVIGAFVFSRFIVLTQLPNELAKLVLQADLAPAWILLAVAALYFLLRTFLDEVSTILITVPVTLPMVLGIGYDGVWFGVFVTVMCTLGLISPPTGMTVFVIQAQHPDIPVTQIYRGTLPFLVADFVLIGLLIAFPALVSWLPAALRM